MNLSQRTMSQRQFQQAVTWPPQMSEHYIPKTMPSVLGSVDMISLFLLNVFWVSNVTPLATGGPVSFTYWMVCGLFFFVPCSLVMAQLAHLFPFAGSIYAWVYHTCGSRWSYFVGLCAWLPGLLSIINAAAAVVSLLQQLNPNWFVFPWQQGCAIVVILLFTWIFSIQSLRTVQNVLNIAVGAMGIAMFLMIIAMVVWFGQGHPSTTKFAEVAGWQMTPSNLALLGSATLALFGSDMPLSMVGETKDRKVIGRHLAWGTLLTLGGYGVFTLAILVIQGATGAQMTINPLGLLIATVDQVLGKAVGNVMAGCLLFYFLMIPVALNLCFSRFILVGAIDRRLSIKLAKLNMCRVPSAAIQLQMILAIVFTVIIFIGVPLFSPGHAADLSSIVYNALGASLLLIWGISFLFPFLSLALFAWHQGKRFRQMCVVPFPLLCISMVCGPALCVIAIALTLFNSFIPKLLPNYLWTPVIGGFAVFVLLCCGVLSLLSNSEAQWEYMQHAQQDIEVQ